MNPVSPNPAIRLVQNMLSEWFQECHDGEWRLYTPQSTLFEEIVLPPQELFGPLMRIQVTPQVGK